MKAEETETEENVSAKNEIKYINEDRKTLRKEKEEDEYGEGLYRTQRDKRGRVNKNGKQKHK